MLRTRFSRALLSAALISLAVALPVATANPAAATQYGTPTLTVKIAGYGTVTWGGYTNTCTTTPTTPGLTAAGQEGTVTGGCTTNPESPGAVEPCTQTINGDEQINNCYIVLTASVPDPSGWTFDHWSSGAISQGNDCGTMPTCTVQISQEIYNTSTQQDDRIWYQPTEEAEFLDTRTPVTQITSGPSENSVNWDDTQTAIFGFGSNEDAEIADSQCQIDGVAYPCVNGTHFTPIADGKHTFCVQQSDGSGLVSAPACRDWEQETSPTASISASPSGDTTDSDAAVALTLSSNKSVHPDDGSVLSYQCWLDSEAPHDCPATGEEAGLANGSHTLHAIATFTPTDGAGAVSSPTATYTWAQNDTTAPIVTFSLPSAQVGTSTPSLTYSSDDSNATMVCSIDASSTPCGATLPSSNGVHTLRVSATDAAGNSGSGTWTWDKENAPVASIVSGPAESARVVGHTATFGLGTPATNTTLACKVDTGSWAACGGTKSLTGLAYGAHTLAVRATYHSTLGSTLAGPIVARHWTMIAPPSCSIRIVQRLRLHHATFTITCNRTGTMALTAQVRIGTHTLLLARGTTAVATGRTKTFRLGVPSTTWNRMVRGHRYRANVQVHSGRSIIGRGTALVYR